MSNVLVTGGAGYVGSVCCAELLRLGHSVTVIDDLSTGVREAVPAGSTFFRLDIGDRTAMESLAGDNSFDVVFHFAAKAVVPWSVTDPGVFFQQNVAAGITMLEVLRTAGIRNFVFSSSAAVYGAPERVPIDEDAPKNPLSSYGETKLMLERVLDWYARAYGWSVIAFRYFNAAGATPGLGERHEPETHVIPLLLQAAAGEREHFTIHGDDYDTPDGTCLRDYIHVLDIAQAHICSLRRLDQPGMRAFNIGLGASYSVRQICHAAEEVTGRSISIRVGQRRLGDPPVLCADPRRIMQELNWKPEHSSLQEIIGSAWQWKLKYPEVYASSAP
ncbi:MAG TPA: UDP-glucose 4-epimerase GalE [Candidatus Saccharimonadales bacterium]|jgi:UDP-glucose 4-epimerase|nr:UDP-glucose 4-epimerase GalE [Candidatus Saccharimonadales bacterium]